MEYDQLVEKFHDMLGTFGKDETEANLITAAALLEGFSYDDIRDAYREALKDFV